jgi:prolipoprotein diacylglyceryltransferase
LNTGQLLSIPFVIAGVYLIWRSRKIDPDPQV